MSREQQHAVTGAATIRASATVGQVTIRMSHRLWIDWGYICIENAFQAGEGAHGHDMLTELRPSMIAVTAASHGIDSAYGALKHWMLKSAVPPAVSKRHDNIRATFLAAYRLGHDQSGRWEREGTWLFGLRDEAVHRDNRVRDTAEHHSGTHTAQEFVAYSHANALRAVRFMLDVFDVFTDKALARPVLAAQVEAHAGWRTAQYEPMRARAAELGLL
jgi:hypothetical protein